MSLLQIVKDACDELSLPRPTVVINSTDQQVRKLLRLANDEGRSLAKRHAWQALTSEHTFTTTATATQLTASALPTDLGWVVPETMWNRTSRRRVTGPLSNQEWQETLGNTVVQVNPAFRIRSNTILISPAPTTGQDIYYEYVSKNWCQASGGTTRSAWGTDSDTGRIDENLMTLGLVWRFRASIGEPYDAALAAYEREVLDAIMRDGSRPRLNMGQQSGVIVPRPPMMPETLIF